MGELLVFLPAGGSPDGYLEDVVRRASSAGLTIRGLYVVDGVWRSFACADWLSNCSSRTGFEEYMLGVLRIEGRSMADKLARLALEAGVQFVYEAVEGDPDRVFADAAARPGVKAVMSPSACGANTRW